MSCLNLAISLFPVAGLVVTPPAPPTLGVDVQPQAQVSIDIKPQATTIVTPAPQASLVVTPAPQAAITIGEVCTVSDGTIDVLAVTNGPLRLRDGGYLLLTPEE